jgi:TonB family protein
VAIDKNGTVIAATTQEAGPSRYFERLALAAAKKWTFAPIETDEEREARLRFSYTRAGVTARAERSP